LWPKLQALGWTTEHGRKGNTTQPYYMPPGVKRGPGKKNRIDYFDSKRRVLDHICDASAMSVAAKKECAVGRHQRPQGSAPMGVKIESEARCCRSTSSVAVGRPLRGWVIVSTGFDAQETAALRLLAARCGAVFADEVPRQPPEAGFAVVAKRPLSTAKFLMALAWGVPPVAESWLRETELTGAAAGAEAHALALTDRAALGRPWDGALQPQPGRVFALAVQVQVRGDHGFQAAWSAVLRGAGALVTAELCTAGGYVLCQEEPLRLPEAEAKRLEETGAHAVGVDWLKACLEAQQEVPEPQRYGVEVVVRQASWGRVRSPGSLGRG